MTQRATINPYEATQIPAEDQRSPAGIWKLLFSGYTGTIVAACVFGVLFFGPFGAIMGGVCSAVMGVPIFLLVWGAASLLASNNRKTCLVAGIGGAMTGAVCMFGGDWMTLAAGACGFFGAFTSARRTDILGTIYARSPQWPGDASPPEETLILRLPPNARFS